MKHKGKKIDCRLDNQSFINLKIYYHEKLYAKVGINFNIRKCSLILSLIFNIN